MKPPIKFSKADFWSSLIIGEIVAWLLIAVIKNLGIKIPYLWFLPIILPALCVVGLYAAYLISRKIAVIYQVAKFVLVGGFNTLADWGILALLIFLFNKYLFIGPNDIFIKIGLISIIYYSLYKSVSFIIAAVNSYLWNKFWTFKQETTKSMGKEFLRFLVVTIIGFLINVGIASGIFRYVSPFDGLNIDQWAIVAAIFATAVSMVWNFLGYKFIVFDDNKN